MRGYRKFAIGVGLLALMAGSACGSDNATTADTAKKASTTLADATTAAEATTTTAAPRALRVLVSNDDGYGARGIDALVAALTKLPDTEVTVIAPKEQQSGQGSNKTEGTLTATDATTISGYPVKAVEGHPYDTVVYALDQGGMAERPDVVMTGINQGANLGPVVDVSGTVGAARAAAQRGVPALASSLGLPDDSYDESAKLAVEWLTKNREALLAGTFPVTVTVLNVPSCTAGSIRGEVTLPLAPDAAGRELMKSDCTSTLENPKDDVEAFDNGFAVLSDTPIQ